MENAILFLDFDGVLHPEYIPGVSPGRFRANTEHFTELPNFEAVLREFPQLQVVISSTWRQRRSLAELQSIFSEDLRHRIIGVTPEFPKHAEGRRQREMEAWMVEHRPGGAWVAIDDWPPLFDQHCENVFFTETLTGLDTETMKAFHTWLRQKIGGVRRE